MTNNTGAVLLQTFLHLVNTKSPGSSNLNVSLLEEPITDAAFSNDTITCYGMYGCFSITSPWINNHTRPVTNFPDHPFKVNTGFCLHTRYNPTECQYLDFNNRTSIFQSFYTPFHKTYFVAHGFMDTGDKPWMKNISRNLLKFEDANVILIDWGGGSVPPYSQAVANIRLVGKIVALLMYTLKVLTGARTEEFHMIGHSLGSHLSGYAGYTLKHNFNSTLGRITGMDPAQPHFTETDLIVRLDPSDASFVDIIHTNARPFVSSGLGIIEPIGHLDFYPNSGDNQPGCSEGMMKFVKEKNQSVYQGLQQFLSCDHIRSHEIFLDSIDIVKSKFLSVECDSWQEFLNGTCFPCKSQQNPRGYYCANIGFPAYENWQTLEKARKESLLPLKLYTITGSKAPYARNLYRVSVTISNSSASIEHKGEIGVFSISIVGSRGKTNKVEMFGERYFPPGSSQQQVIGVTNVGEIKSATLYWEHKTTVNFLTWRVDSIIHVGSVTLESFVDNKRLHLCPLEDEVLGSHSSKRMFPCEY